MAYTAPLPPARTGATPGTIQIAPDVDQVVTAITELRTKAVEADPAGAIRLVKTADQGVTNSADATTDVTDLQVTVGANETWDISATLYLDGDTAGDFKLALAGPAGATWHGWCEGLSSGAGGTSGAQNQQTISAAGVIASFGTLGVGVRSHVRMGLTLENAGTAGTFKFQFGQGTSNATPTRVLAKSNVVAVRV